jgi:hypothetical protein
MFSRVLSCSLFVPFPNHPPHSPPLSSAPLCHFLFLFLLCFVLALLKKQKSRRIYSTSLFVLFFFFFPLLKKQKSSRIYCSREDSWKLAPTSSMSLSCHKGVSKDKLLQPVNITKQKMQCPSISDFNNLWPNVLGFSEVCRNELCLSLQNDNERNLEMWKNV